jgi:hypothetical protein
METLTQTKQTEGLGRSPARRQLEKIFDRGDSVISSASGAALLGAAVAGLGGSLLFASLAGVAMIYFAASRNGTH